MVPFLFQKDSKLCRHVNILCSNDFLQLVALYFYNIHHNRMGVPFIFMINCNIVTSLLQRSPMKKDTRSSSNVDLMSNTLTP